MRDELNKERNATARAETKLVAGQDEAKATREAMKAHFVELKKVCDLDCEVSTLQSDIDRLRAELKERDAQVQTYLATIDKANQLRIESDLVRTTLFY